MRIPDFAGTWSCAIAAAILFGPNPLVAASANDTATASSASEHGVIDLTPWVLDWIRIQRGGEAQLDWSRIDAPDPRDIEEASHQRPALSGPELLLESDQFILHYTLEGDDAVSQEQADTAFAAIEHSWSRIIDDMGYPAPPSDGMNGGDGRYDFYFVQLRLAYGVTYGEDQIDANSMSSYIGLGSWMDAREIRVTVAHEFFHASHFMMDAFEDVWWYEVSSTWMEEQVYDTINDYYNYLPSTYNSPETPLTSTNTMYANAIWGLSLSEAHGEEVIRDIWFDAAESVQAQALESNKTVLTRDYRASWSKTLHGWRESMVDADRFEEGSEYPEVQPTTTVSDFPLSTTTGTVASTGANMLQITPPSGADPTTLSVSVPDSTDLVYSLLLKNGQGAWVEFGQDTMDAQSWSVPGFGGDYSEAFVVVTNVALSGDDDYTITVEAPGWTSGGDGGCSGRTPSPLTGAMLWFSPLLLLRRRRSRSQEQ